jgi:hypothetical protein
MDFILLLLCNLFTLSFSKINNLTLEQETGYLNPSEYAGCSAPCDSYHAGASIDSILICTYQASGVGTLEQNVEKGISCYPSYNCREDWNICIQWNKSDSVSPSHIPLDNPYYNISNRNSLRNACSEISNLIAGGSSGANPPNGGWKPTSLGWKKGSGNIGCGWGSTFSDVRKDSPFSLSDFGRIEISNFNGNEIDCCMEAMKYEAVDIKHGGSAIRFDVYNSKCRIDREIMMRGNLDSSSGRSLDKLDHCGEDNVDFFYWRNAAGSANAANLQSSGICGISYNFTRVSSSNAIKPLGRLPDGAEIPNRLPECEGSQPEMCLESLRYNSINTLEKCCEVCSELRWLPNIENIVNPCVAYQIADGKCRILRKKWFDIRYGQNNLGNYPSGNNAMSITEVIDVCAGFRNHDACSRKDNSHGYWGTCSDSENPPIDNDCSYFSHIYYRDPLYTNFSNKIDNSTNIYRKIQTLNLNNNGTSMGLNISINTSIIRDRTDKKQTLTNSPINSIPSGLQPNDPYIDGFEQELEQENEEVSFCSRVSLYIQDTNLLHYDVYTNMDVFNPHHIIPAVHISNQCCLSHYHQHRSHVNEYCEINLNVTAKFIEKILEKQINEQNGRRLSTITKPKFILSYECIGNGKDLCDMSFNAFNILPDTIYDITENLEIVSPSPINNNPSPSNIIDINEPSSENHFMNSDIHSPSPSSNFVISHYTPSPENFLENVNSSMSRNINILLYILVINIIFILL